MKQLETTEITAIGTRILGELKLRGAFGPHRAVPRKEILEIVNRARRSFSEERDHRPITDVTFRGIYRKLPICSGDAGLYLPTNPEHLEAFEDYLKAKARGIFRRIRIVQEQNPALGPLRKQLVLDLDGPAAEDEDDQL